MRKIEKLWLCNSVTTNFNKALLGMVLLFIVMKSSWYENLSYQNFIYSLVTIILKGFLIKLSKIDKLSALKQELYVTIFQNIHDTILLVISFYHPIAIVIMLFSGCLTYPYSNAISQNSREHIRRFYFPTAESRNEFRTKETHITTIGTLIGGALNMLCIIIAKKYHVEWNVYYTILGVYISIIQLDMFYSAIEYKYIIADYKKVEV